MKGENDAKVLVNKLRFKYEGHYWWLPIKNRTIVLQMLERITDAGIKVNNIDDLVEMIKLARPESLPGKVDPLALDKLRRKPIKKRLSALDIYFWLVDDIPFLGVYQNENASTIAALRRIVTKFRIDLPSFYRIVSKGNAEQALLELYKAGYRAINCDRLLMGLKRNKIPYANLPEDFCQGEGVEEEGEVEKFTRKVPREPKAPTHQLSSIEVENELKSDDSRWVAEVVRRVSMLSGKNVTPDDYFAWVTGEEGAFEKAIRRFVSSSRLTEFEETGAFFAAVMYRIGMGAAEVNDIDVASVNKQYINEKGTLTKIGKKFMDLQATKRGPGRPPKFEEI
jgi:hypothetical protein